MADKSRDHIRYWIAANVCRWLGHPCRDVVYQEGTRKQCPCGGWNVLHRPAGAFPEKA